MNVFNDVTIRPYRREDKKEIRRICYETSLLERPFRFFEDGEVFVDVLTVYFLDYEPQGCFVACRQEKIVGYIFGTKNASKMAWCFNFKIVPRLIVKAFAKGIFFKKKTWQFIFYSFISLLKGEFFAPHVSRQYPALLHINLDKNSRGQKIGSRLMKRFFVYLKENNTFGVHLSTLSEPAKAFFVHEGFHVLHQAKRSYMRYQLGCDIQCYMLGKFLGQA